MLCRYYFEVITFLTCCFTAANSYKDNYIDKSNCVIHVANTEINISTLNNENGYKVTSQDKTYFINICGPASRCKHPNASVCEINSENEKKILGQVNKGNLHKNELRYKYNNEKTVIEFKCNRHREIPYIQHDTSIFSKNVHKFIFYSSRICVKMPINCKVVDVENNNLQYDISSLYNKNHNWAVNNVFEDLKVYMNLCGNLHSISGAKNNECAYDGTQICMVDQKGKSTNLGVFSNLLQPTENGLTVNFTGGSLCSNSSSISTKIDFVCSFNNSGPNLTFASDCEYVIIWRTPAACPYSMSISSNCTFQNKLLYISKDKSQNFSENVIIKYNICGSLSGTCNGQKNVGACFIKKDKEIILGMANSTVISKDATVYSKLVGESCQIKNVNHSVYIHFQCDYGTRKKFEEISFTTCSTKITVFTMNACIRPDVLVNKPCTFSVNDSLYYNLSSLVLTNRNYEVSDPDDTTKTYLLNLCRPIVIDSNSLCPVGSSICLRNNAEPNKYKKFKSLGNYKDLSEMQMQNEKLIIQYENVMCPNPHVNIPNYKTVIEFQCVHNLKSEIHLKSKFNCQYTFLWKTQHACRSEDTNITLKMVKSNTENIEQTPILNNSENFIKNVTMEHIKLEQLTNTESVEQVEILNKNEHTNNEQLQLQSTTKAITISMNIPIEDTHLSGIFIKNCSLRDNIHKVNVYNMHSLPQNTQVLSKSGKTYLVNICNKNACTSMLCLTNLQIALRKQYVIMNFTEDSWCNNRPYTSVIFLKCSNELKDPIIVKEQDCSVELEWKNKAACAFLKADSQVESHVESTTGKTVALSVGVISIVVVLCLAGFAGQYYFKRKRSQRESTHQLLRCEYSRVKDFAKIA